MVAKAAKGKKPARNKVKAGTSKVSAADRKKLFIEAYVTNGGNATQAAVSAGLSAKTARQQGARLLSDVAIKAEIAKRAELVAEKYELTTDLVTKSIVQELRFNPKNLYKEDGSLKAMHELDDDTVAGLTGVELIQVGNPDAPIFVRKLKWVQKQGAREQAMKHLGMFAADNKQKNPLEGLPYEHVAALVAALKDGR